MAARHHSRTGPKENLAETAWLHRMPLKSHPSLGSQQGRIVAPQPSEQEAGPKVLGRPPTNFCRPAEKAGLMPLEGPIQWAGDFHDTAVLCRIHLVI